MTAVDSVLLADGTKRKRLTLIRADAQTFGDKNFWIEGIGSTGGLLTHFWGLCFTDYSEFLLCFHENGDLQFQPEPNLSCFMVGADEISDENKIKIYPNPAAAVLTVEMPESGTADIFMVSDFTCKRLKTESISRGEKILTIPVNDLSSGIYFLQLCTNGWIVKTQKFVIKR
ncbi:MAG TPA: T9SS type A sorting domain-containing protein [Saprospiraceae bacterium]|nr:T9SS type A sorting domain-containing protein [Saprospiraceae bacterium]